MLTTRPFRVLALTAICSVSFPIVRVMAQTVGPQTDLMAQAGSSLARLTERSMDIAFAYDIAGAGNPEVGLPPCPPGEDDCLDTMDQQRTIMFEFGKTELTPSSVQRIAGVCASIRKLPLSIAIRLEGHTDAVGSAEVNQRLSEARAETVAELLHRECAVGHRRLVTVGRGETELLPGYPGEAGAHRRLKVYAIAPR